VDLFHATNLESSVFGIGPVSLIQEGCIPRKGSRVKVKLKLDAICSPAMFDHAGDHLAPVEKFRLLIENLATVQNRVLAPSVNMLLLVDDGRSLSDKSERSRVSSSVLPPPRKPRVLVWIRRDLFIARRFVAADCFPAREFERVPYAKPFSFAKDWWSWRGGGKEVWAEILKMAPGGRGGVRRPGGRGNGSGQPSSDGRVQQKPQPPPVKVVPNGPGSSTGEQAIPQSQPQMTGDFGGFQQMWSNPQFQGFGPWQNAFPLQFMPQMMQGSQMQFPLGPFPGQFQ
jgi:hypothetical protein